MQNGGFFNFHRGEYLVFHLILAKLADIGHDLHKRVPLHLTSQISVGRLGAPNLEFLDGIAGGSCSCLLLVELFDNLCLNLPVLLFLVSLGFRLFGVALGISLSLKYSGHI